MSGVRTEDLASGTAAASDATAASLAHRVGLISTLVLGGAVLGIRLHSGWFPHDEGLLGQSAERVLLGEVPHRDFDELYTGLLTYFHALAFRLQDVSSATMRLPLFAATLLWLTAIYRLLTRFVPPAGAAIVALLVLVWSVPNYPAPMPSWYVLFCTTFGMLALVCWVEDPRPRWLFLAGFAGGVSFLFKLTGIFFLPAIVLAVAATTGELAGTGERTPGRHWARPAVVLMLLAPALCLGLVVAAAGPTEAGRFALPLVLVAAACAWREWHHISATHTRVRELLTVVTTVAIGAAVPILVFFAWFAANGALPDLLRGVFVVPFERTTFARIAPPPPSGLLAAVPLLWLLWPRREPESRRWYAAAAFAGTALLLVLILSRTEATLYTHVWRSAWSLPVVASLIGAAAVLLPPHVAGHAAAARKTLVILALSAVFGLLVEYPFAAPIYTLYALPLAILTIVAAVRLVGRIPPALQATVLAFFLLFGLLRLLPTQTAYLGSAFSPRQETALLQLPRGGLWVHPAQAREYETLVAFLAERGATRVWAGPDSPEIYFLSGARNRTRTMFEFFDEGWGSSDLRARLQDLDIDLIVLNLLPEFSPWPDQNSIEEIGQDYPHMARTPRFLVMWK